jgi:hypothetical protein
VQESEIQWRIVLPPPISMLYIELAIRWTPLVSHLTALLMSIIGQSVHNLMVRLSEAGSGIGNTTPPD